MPDLSETISIFTRARYAAWAGDLPHSRRLLHSITPQSKGPTEPERGWDSMGMVLHAASELLAHISDETDAKQEALAEAKSALPDDRLIVMSHLRGVIHRTGEYEFEVRAFLDDLEWEASLYERCSELSATYAPSVRERVRKLRRTKLRTTVELRRPSASWRIVDQELLRTVSLGPFGLIKIEAIWITYELPQNFERIRKKLEDTLEEIDHREEPADEAGEPKVE